MKILLNIPKCLFLTLLDPGSSTNRIRNQGNCVRRLISTELHLSVFSAETISSDKMSIDILDTL